MSYLLLDVHTTFPFLKVNEFGWGFHRPCDIKKIINNTVEMALKQKLYITNQLMEYKILIS